MSVLTPASVFRQFETDGVPSSGKHKPEKAEIIQLLNQLFGTSRGGWVVAQTKAELDGITPEGETDGGVVLTGDEAGYYDRDGGVWMFGRGFPDTFARVELSGSGTAQTGTLLAGVNPSMAEVFFAFVQTDNTGPLTLSISGEAPREVVNLAGNPLASGEWTGTVMFALRDGDYQLLIDAGAAASAAQSASDAADQKSYAEEWAQSDDPISVEAGGDGSTDRSAKYWAGQAGEIAVPDGSITAAKITDNPEGQEAIREKLGVAVNIPADLNNLSVTGPFIAGGGALNTPAGLTGAGSCVVIDNDNAVQQFVSTSEARTFSRVKVAGDWIDWRELMAESASVWPAISGDNIIDEIPVDSTSGWSTSGAGATLTTNGSRLQMSTTGSAGVSDLTITGPTSGDYIIYAKLSSDYVSDGSVTLQLGGAGDGRFLVSLGYNWSTSAAEQGRISARFGSSGAIVGPLIDYSTPVEIALLCNAEFGAGTLFIKESGVWVGYGVVAGTDVYRNTIRLSLASGGGADLFIHELFIAKPNIVAIGDSITRGSTLYSPDPVHGLSNYSSTWMASAPIYEGKVRNNIIVNKGVGGENSSEIDARVAGILADADPQIVFLEASANDYGASFSQAVRTANIQASVDKIVGSGAKVALTNAVYPNTGGTPPNADYYREWWQQYRSGVTDVDIFIDWMAGSGILDGNYMDVAYTQADGVHPNPAGYSLLGGYIASLEQ